MLPIVAIALKMVNVPNMVQIKLTSYKLKIAAKISKFSLNFIMAISHKGI